VVVVSESEEMYLITIARFKEEGFEGPVPLSKLSEVLSVVPVSANQMVKKLAASGYVRYLPYKGVFLTARGEEAASRVIRHRRLWEYFLVEHLGLPHREADALACRMEHITTDPLAGRLSSYLGDPDRNSEGKPIPGAKQRIRPEWRIPLSEVDVGKGCYVEFIEGGDKIQQFLLAEGLHRGAEASILARGSQGSLLVEVQGKQISLSPETASCVHVQVAQQGTLPVAPELS
jgi:DtxR family transcriptional regulator, Mn-dependent transcriptional regulator